MAYVDPRVTYEFGAAAAGGAPVETAAILKKNGRMPDAATAADADQDGVLCPAGASIEAFGVEVTEALTNGNAQNCIVTLKVLDKPGGTAASAVTLTLPADSTEVVTADVRASDTTSPTAAQAVAVGARFVSSSTSLPYVVGQGGLFYVEITQAAGAAGGAIKAFVVARQNGQPGPGAAATSPVTTLSS